MAHIALRYKAMNTRQGTSPRLSSASTKCASTRCKTNLGGATTCLLFIQCFVGTRVHCLLGALLILASSAFLMISCTDVYSCLGDCWYLCRLLTRRDEININININE